MVDAAMSLQLLHVRQAKPPSLDIHLGSVQRPWHQQLHRRHQRNVTSLPSLSDRRADDQHGRSHAAAVHARNSDCVLVTSCTHKARLLPSMNTRSGFPFCFTCLFLQVNAGYAESCREREKLHRLLQQLVLQAQYNILNIFRLNTDMNQY